MNTSYTRRQKVHEIIVKTMKGDQDFRNTTQSSLQSTNETYVYKSVIPSFKQFVAETGSNVFTDWVPRIYFADFGHFPELSEDFETILALENLKPAGYRLGPRIDLDETHLRMMLTNIATYHAVNYAMKIKNPSKVDELRSGLQIFSYMSKEGKELESYRVAFMLGMNRFFPQVENDPKYQEIKGFLDSVKKFKAKYYHQPTILMQSLIDPDDVYSLINHGDYNRNNVLFEYDQPEGFESPKSLRMFDFQEVRFSSPVVDLTFFMYMNTPAEIRDRLWDEFLKLYHDTLYSSLMELLKCSADDARIQPYNFENFMQHFKKFAFYGVMICIHFVPWMACPEEECSQISHLFETDLHSKELERLTMICGGKNVDDRIVGIAIHSFKKGYWKIFD